MRHLKLSQSKPNPAPAPSARQAAAAAADTDPLARAERVYGAPEHLVLLSDNGPALSFMGWTIGAARAEAVDESEGTRTVEMEVMFSETGDYVVSERIETRVGDTVTAFAATVTEFPSPRDVIRYCETATLDPQADATRAAAVDHAARHWPWLKRSGRREKGSAALKLPFAL
jgi:hypothetical protein